MAKSTVRNKRLRQPVTMVTERPRLERLGKAGARLKLDLMLTAVHGHTEAQWQKLNAEERAVLRQMAMEEDPELGLSHQANAIGALGQLRDPAALLVLSEVARSARADDRLRIQAVHALAEIGGDEVRPVLRSLLAAKPVEVRAQAARALAKVGTTEDVSTLESLAQADKSYAARIVREAAGLLRQRLARPPRR